MKKLCFFASLLMIGQMLCTPLMAFEPFVVKAIQIEGNQRLSREAVLEDLPVAVGEQFTAAKSNTAIHSLFSTGFYQDVTLERDGSTLIVKLVERPSIGKLEIKGIKNNDEINKILKENNVAEGRVYDPNIISKVEKEIIREYLTKQRYGVKVETKVTQQERNRVAVVIDIYEGTVATIKDIKFVGNHAFSDKELRKQILHKTKNWLSWFDKSDHYSKEKFAADLEILRSFYMDHGYINFKVESTQVSLSVDKKFVYLTINVSEGEQFFFKKMSLEGDIIVDRDQLQTIIDKKIKPGAVFSSKLVMEVKDEMEQLLGKEGYSKANIRILDDIDPEKKLVNLRFYIDANRRITVRRVVFEGNTLTQDKVLRRDLEQFEGSWIDTEKIKESKEAIMRDGYASKVDVQNVPVMDKDDQIDLLYKIDEQRTANVSAGLSYSAAESISLNLGADLKNFVGTGKDVSFAFNHGKAIQSYSLSYNNPYFTDSGVGMGYSLYRTRNRLSKTSLIFDYRLDVTGFNLGWQFRVSQYNYIKVGGGADHSVLKMNYFFAPYEAQSFVRAYHGGQAYAPNNMDIGFKEYFINLGWVHNNLDNFLFPTKGWSQSIDGRINVPASQLKVYRLDYDINWFKTLIDPYVLNLHGDLGYQDVYKTGKPFPFFKHYYLGGADSIRGFEERSLGPVSSRGDPFGGNALVQGRVQIIFPPPFVPDTKTMRMALFLDAGQVYDTHDKKTVQGVARNPKGIRYSTGVSFVWNTPLHVPIAVSFAWPLNKQAGDHMRVFAFSLGTQF